MIITAFVAALILLLLGFMLLAACIRVLPQHERGVLFRLGRVMPGPVGPGLIILLPALDRLVRVPIASQVAEVACEDVSTRDSTSGRASAAISYRILDPVKAVTEVDDFRRALELVAEKRLRASISESSKDDLRFHSQGLRESFTQTLAELTSTWGLRIEKVEIEYSRRSGQ